MPTMSDGVQPSSDELIRLRLLARDLPLNQHHALRSVIVGCHRSQFRGRGMDYEESRSYQPGDDIRNMDWRVTARSGRAHVKVYEEERERPVVIMADFGPGMFFATQGAFRIGALLYNGKHHELRPTGGQRGALRLIRELVTAADPAKSSAATAHDRSSFNDALSRLRRVVRPGSLVFMLSDFYQFDADSKQHLQLLRRHNDIVACQILDRLELQPPAPGRYPINYAGQQGILDTRSRTQREAWTQHFAERRQHVSDLMQQCAVPLIRLNTADDVGQSLRQALTRPQLSNTEAVA
jgi:uncharacterized protein (DUF58 family)